MDPDALLRNLIDLAHRTVNGSALEKYERDAEFDRMAEMVIDLDAWLVSGGFLPARWQKKEG